MITNRNLKKAVRKIDERTIAKGIIILASVLIVGISNSAVQVFEIIGAIVVFGIIFNILISAINKI